MFPFQDYKTVGVNFGSSSSGTVITISKRSLVSFEDNNSLMGDNFTTMSYKAPGHASNTTEFFKIKGAVDDGFGNINPQSYINNSRTVEAGTIILYNTGNGAGNGLVGTLHIFELPDAV